MINSIKEYGSTSENTGDYMYYNIELKYEKEGKEYKETFTGVDYNEVLQNAMKFIIKNYKNT